MAGKKAKKKDRSITIKLTFTEDNLQSMLDAANFGDGESLKVGELSAKRFKELKAELELTAPNFVDEIVDGSRDACANDWLYEFAPEDPEEDE
jgi:hypothetical protein